MDYGVCLKLKKNPRVHMYAIPCSRYKSIVGKYMDGRAQIQEDGPRSTAPKRFKKYHGEVVFYANGILYKDTSQGILRLEGIHGPIGQVYNPKASGRSWRRPLIKGCQE
jgi:hypothetical protein